MQVWISGETLPRTFTLLVDGSVLNLTGSTAELLLTDLAGTVVSTSGDITVPTPANGQIIYSPDVSDLYAAGSPFSALFKVTNSLGQIGYFPGTGADTWYVGSAATGVPATTYLDLRKQVLRWLDALVDLNTGNVLDELVKQQLNDSQMSRVSEYPWPWLRTTTTLAVTPSALRYALPGNLQRLLYAYSAVDARHLTKAPDRSWADLALRLDGVNSSGSVYQPYTVEGQVLRFLEPPRQSETLHLGYYRMPQPLVNDQDIPDLPYPYGRILVWDSLLDLKSYAKDLDAVSLWVRKQEKAVSDLYANHIDGQTLNEFPLLIHRSMTE